jgi:20S proteasome alpha/beta subunit
MTTIIGIQADEGIVLFADTQALHPKGYLGGDGKFPQPRNKINVLGDYCAVANCGYSVKPKDLANILGSGSRKATETLKERLDRADSKFADDYKDVFKDVSMLVAMRLEKPELYLIDKGRKFVRLKRRFITLGSGGKYAHCFLRNNLNGNHSIGYAIRMGYRAERCAFNDMNTGGFVSFAVITQEEIDRTGARLHRQVLNLEKTVVAETAERYRRN